MISSSSFQTFSFLFFRLTFSVISVILWIPLYFLSYCHYFYFYCHSVLAFMLPPPYCPTSSVLPFSPSHAFVPNPAPPPLCMVKYSVKDGSRGGSGGDRVAGRGGIGGGGEGNIDVKSAAVVTIFCSLFLCTSGPLRATVSSTVFTGSWKKEEESFTFVMVWSST